MPIQWEERIASLIAAGGLGWCVYAATQRFTSIDAVRLPNEAMYTVAIGVVLWLHAKWRRSVDGPPRVRTGLTAATQRFPAPLRYSQDSRGYGGD
jgi:hypothetical protein